MSTVGRRLLAAYGAGDTAELSRLYHPEATLYDPAWWPAEGRAAILDTVKRAHAELPGMTVSLHDEFASAGGGRVALRWVRHWPGGEPNTSNELRVLTVEDGRIVREVVGYVTLEIPGAWSSIPRGRPRWTPRTPIRSSAPRGSERRAPRTARPTPGPRPCRSGGSTPSAAAAWTPSPTCTTRTSPSTPRSAGDCAARTGCPGWPTGSIWLSRASRCH